MQYTENEEPATIMIAGSCFLIVGVTRLELATSRPPDAYSNQLSYTPIWASLLCFAVAFLSKAMQS